MPLNVGQIAFLLAPPVLAAVVLWRFPKARRVRWYSLALYVAVMSGLIYGAMRLVTWIADARVHPWEVVVVLWFTIAWRLVWTLWTGTVGQAGQKYLRLARWRRRTGKRSPWRIQLIPAGRIALTAFVFVPAFLSTALTHRFKLADGTDPQHLFGLKFEPIAFTSSDGLKLDGWFIPDKHAASTIVVCHGAGANKGNFIWFLTALANHGYNVLFFDFRAHGGSDGRTITYGTNEWRDVIAAVDWLKCNRPEAARQIIGLGSSQGSFALALAAARDRRIDAIILDSPFTSPHALAMHHARRIPLLGPAFVETVFAAMCLASTSNLYSPSAVAAVADIERPVMIIHGNQDMAMPAEHAQRLYDAAAGPKEIWFGPGPHSNIITTVPDEYAKRIFAFLKRTDGTTSPAAQSAPELTGNVYGGHSCATQMAGRKDVKK